MKIRDIPIGGKFRYHGKEFTVIAFLRGKMQPAFVDLFTCETDAGIFGTAEHTFNGEIEIDAPPNYGSTPTPASKPADFAAVEKPETYTGEKWRSNIAPSAKPEASP